MARGGDRTAPQGIFRKEKENPNAKHDRWWALGAWINQEGNLEIRRDAESPYLKAGDNKVLVLNQNDDETNPEVLEIINAGTGNVISVRDEIGGSIVGGMNADGTNFASSSETLKENLKNMGDSVAEKHIENLAPKSFSFKKTGNKQFGLTAENFKEVTGYGDGRTISPIVVAGLAVRYIQFLHKKLKAVESQLKVVQQAQLAQNADAPKA